MVRFLKTKGKEVEKSTSLKWKIKDEGDMSAEQRDVGNGWEVWTLRGLLVGSRESS